MKKNVGTIDRAIRLIVGLALVAWAIWGTGSYTWIGWIGLVAIGTAAIGWCPPYAILGISTCSTKSAKS